MQLHEILNELRTYRGTFPRYAVKQAIEEREAITPALLEALEYGANNIEELCEDTTAYLHIYALYLLAQFREKKAYPVIVDFFYQTGDKQEMPEQATGDIITEDLCRILASVCHGDITLIQQLIENPEINEWTRSAALDSLVVLVVEDVLPREEVIRYLEELFSGKLDKEPDDSKIWTYLARTSYYLCAIELKPYIEQAYKDDRVETFFISLKNINRAFEEGVDATMARLHKRGRYTFINDTIAEMESWACFKKTQKRSLLTPPKFDKTVQPKASGFAGGQSSGSSKSSRKNRSKKKKKKK
ncbi:hypothetical protein AY599_19430 [Leptolyngbya valderiana BDU 20041]|nr:hypothetical protein AY599_19430 [Leptolyngbya valderiana BDU 20041]PPT08569.1 hypothetical protein CKA32_004360 [Geitlerinema sp. FC II]